MNIKAERIEQLIQIINRNLLFAFSGQTSSTPVEFKKLQRVEAGIFGHDKFAFEMVHFVKSSNEQQFDGSIAQTWEKCFVRGLETLLVECAIVRDDIERDCFVSRVYCWFTEKLVERRDLPRSTVQGGFDELKANIRTMGTAQHTLKGLESYEKGLAQAQSPTNLQWAENEDKKLDDTGDLPQIRIPDSPSKFGSRQIPVYVKGAFPDVMQGRTNYKSLLPKIPGAEANYGMMYNEPETEAERSMHELWLARRRQEAFEWKTQQHLALVVDRLGLHKSRLESDSLRRQESTAYLQATKQKDHQRARSADSTTSSRFAPQTPRPQSGKRRQMLEARNRSVQFLRSGGRGGRDDASAASEDSDRSQSPIRNWAKSTAATSAEVRTAMGIPDGPAIRVSSNGVETETKVPQPGRTVVTKPATKTQIIPMRFRMDPPDAFIRNYEKQQFYMQLSDSDDDDKPDLEYKEKAKVRVGTGGKKGAKPPSAGGGAAAIVGKPAANFKREKPVIRERPHSAKLFRNVAINDPEFKVLYRYSNFRRMPMTEEQEEWLSNREHERAKKSEDKAVQLATEVAEKEAKKKAKDKDKGKDGKGKDADKDGKDKKKKAAAAVVVEEKPKPKYKSATEFMATHFPNFDGDDDGDPDAAEECRGPMRTMQLIECAQITDAFAAKKMGIKESALIKALVIPQDRPEAICLEGMREGGEGLMVNPLPFEFWRKALAGKKKKGGGKKKKGKK